MKSIVRSIFPVLIIIAQSSLSLSARSQVDPGMIAKIREEGLQRSQVMDIVGNIVDVLGARLTNSENK